MEHKRIARHGALIIPNLDGQGIGTDMTTAVLCIAPSQAQDGSVRCGSVIGGIDRLLQIVNPFDAVR